MFQIKLIYGDAVIDVAADAVPAKGDTVEVPGWPNDGGEQRSFVVAKVHHLMTPAREKFAPHVVHVELTTE